jgi:hypothetical protein
MPRWTVCKLTRPADIIRPYAIYQLSLRSPGSCGPWPAARPPPPLPARLRRFGPNSRRNSIHAPIRKATQTIAGGASAARSCSMKVTSAQWSAARFPAVSASSTRARRRDRPRHPHLALYRRPGSGPDAARRRRGSRLAPAHRARGAAKVVRELAGRCPGNGKKPATAPARFLSVLGVLSVVTAEFRAHNRSSMRVLPKMFGLTRSRSRNSATPSS